MLYSVKYHKTGMSDFENLQHIYNYLPLPAKNDLRTQYQRLVEPIAADIAIYGIALHRFSLSPSNIISLTHFVCVILNEKLRSFIEIRKG